MKTIPIKNRNQIKKISLNFLKLVFLCFAFIPISCNDDESCEYDEPCIESCQLFEDFENKELNTSGNWLGVDLGTDGVLYESRNSNTTLHANDGSGGSYIYNDSFVPSNNLLELGCELTFDVEYVAGNGNGASATNSIRIYDGTSPLTRTFLATFVLNTASAIIDNSGPQTISVPLELASGSTLPTNSFGKWIISPSTTPTADVSNFNNLIQNITGVSFWLDVVNPATGASAPTEQWWFDNFCFKQCCPN